jgi:hypothetical protein
MAAVRESIMGEVGNLSAPPGSRDWAIAVRLELQFTLNNVKGDAEHLDDMIALIREHQGYRQLTNRKGRPFLSYESFCVEPQPFGLGYRTEDINRIIGERRATARAKDRAEQATPLKAVGAPLGNQNALKVAAEPIDDLPLMQSAAKNNVRNTNIESRKGRSETADYLTARIARDRPDIFDRMRADEFSSVRQAALAAGIIKPEFSIPIEPQGAARRILNRFRGEPLLELIRVLVNHAGGTFVEPEPHEEQP